MSDELAAPFDATDFVLNEQKRSMTTAITSLEDDPEKAARAKELSQATGAHPALVYGDVEGFGAQHRAKLTAELLNSNKYLSEYVASHPLAGKISNDDYGQLDATSSALTKLSAGASSVLGKAFQGFKENFDAEGMTQEHHKLSEMLQANPLFGNVFIRQAVEAGGLALDASMRTVGGIIGGASAAVGESYKQLGGNEAMGDRLTRDLIIMANVAMSGQAGFHGIVSPEVHAEIAKFTGTMKPYLESGKEPPLGLHPEIDKIKTEQSKQDLDNLSEALKEAQASKTKERSPELFADYVRQHTDDKIGISAEAVQKLYGDKPPTADDNLLGWAPGIAEQLKSAVASGGDIEIPLADWLARVDPAVAKELHDDIRVRRGGVTKNEVKELAEVTKARADIEAFHGSPHEFDVFSMEKIGTGEGAQSYGHGLYFAEQPDVAKSYARLTPDSAKFDADNPYQTGGPLYRVRIKADKEQFLDWDKPLGEQPVAEKIRKAVGEQRWEQLKDKTGEDLIREYSKAAGRENTSKNLHAAGIPGIKYLDQGSRHPFSIKELHESIAELERDNPSWATEKIAFYKQRIEDIKDNNVTHNFVLFDDSLVEITHKNDQAVAAIRKASELTPLAENEALQGLYDKLARGYDKKYSDEVSARLVPTKELLAHEKEIEKAANDLLNRIAGKSVRRQIADYVGLGDRQIQGVYLSFDKLKPLIVYSLKAENIPDTVRHEAIHFLRDYNFITPKEWKVLEREAESNGWMEKHGITKQYAGQKLSKADLLEEAIAKEYGEWGSTTAKAGQIAEKYSKQVGATFDKIKEILAQMRDAIKEIFGHSPDVADLFEKIESGEVAKRGPGKPRWGTKDIRADEKQGELPQFGTTRMEDRELFSKSAAIGMTVEQYKRYMKLIEKRRAEDQNAIAEIALKEEKKHQTAEWKANSAIIRQEVAADIRNRPDIAADDFLRAGEHKIAEGALSDEQKAALPKSYVARTGVSPDDIAGFFGYSTGSGLVDRLVALNQARDAAGMKPEAYVRRVIDSETERRMEAKYGNLERNILEEAKEHVLSETQMDLLHEETLALGMKAGGEFSITKEQMKAWVKGEFDQTRLGAISSDSYLASAGKAGRLAEMHLLRDEPGDAFKAKQQQYIAVAMAREAKKVEKQREQFDRTAKRFSARELATVDQEYTNFIHDILMRTGNKVKRSVQDLADSIARGEQKNLADFVEYKEVHGMRELPVAEFLFDPAFRKKLDDLTVQEFQALHDSVKALVKNGRDEKKITKAGEEADLAEVKSQMMEQLKTFAERHYDAEGKRWLGPIPPAVAKPMRTFLASVLQLESVFNRWDRGDPRGVFTQYVSRELSTAANFEASLERKYSRLLGGIADKADLKAKVPNDLFIDPFSKTETDPGVPINLTRKNLRAILLNAGNASNLDKLSRGYGVKPEQVMQWLHQHATKEDWDWAQKMGDIFAEIKKEADVMYRGLAGIEPENIPIERITTPHGEYAGWYYPVVYHPVWEGKSKRLMGGDALEQENYVRATTPRGYTKARTGYSAPMDLSLDSAPVRMKQMIHDIAFRPAVINASKIFYDRDIRNTVSKHYGREYSNLLVPYLRDVANSANFRSDAASVGANVSEFIRQNVIATLIGLNPGTVLKHFHTAAINSLTEVGPMNFLHEVKGLASVNDETGNRNWSFAMETSEELQRRHRHWNETLGGAQQNLQSENTLRNTVMKYGAMPVALSDLLSAVPTWLAQYKKTMREPEATHGDAVFAADRAVRRAHGSSVVTNRPALMRGGPLASWLTSLYGFFNHILNRQYELMWKAGDTLDLVKAGEWKEASKNSPQLMAGLFSYIIFPALVEEMVTPLSNDQHESWGKKAAKAIGFTIGSSWPIVRDVVAAGLHGRDPSAGLLSTAGKEVTDVVRDLSKGKQAFDKAHAGNLIQHGVTMFGGLTGLANAQIGKSGKFIYNYSTGQERPKGFGDWWKGLRRGTMKEHP